MRLVIAIFSCFMLWTGLRYLDFRLSWVPFVTFFPLAMTTFGWVLAKSNKMEC